MNIASVQSVYFLGIGGIGMSALARYFHQRGAKVSGYDKTPSPLTNQLQTEGIDCFFNDAVEHIPLNADLYVFTPAIPKSHPAFDFVRSHGAQWHKRSEVLEWITNQTQTIAVAGTHGKTTTSAILSHLMHRQVGKVAGFVGGIMSNYDSNLIASSNPEITIVEADEYDRSFLRLNPTIAIITSLDADHLDIYGTYESMVDDYRLFASRAKTLIIHDSVADQFEHPDKRVYGQSENSDFRIENIRVSQGQFVFDFGNKPGLSLALPGVHNVNNACAALSVGKVIGVDLSPALSSFKGVKRRFERVFESADKAVIDDYAHHPAEIEAAIAAARKLFPHRRVAVLFQPHLFSRTRDFEQDFADSLSKADELLLMPIYPAREEPIAGVDSAHLLNKVKLKTRRLVQKSEVVNAVISLSAETILILGAGDIDRLVQPIVNQLNQTSNVA